MDYQPFDNIQNVGNEFSQMSITNNNEMLGTDFQGSGLEHVANTGVIIGTETQLVFATL